MRGWEHNHPAKSNIRESCWPRYGLSHHPGVAQTSFSYPLTPVRPIADTIFGQVIIDNYRWLGDANNSEVQEWLKQQAEFTNRWLDKIPGRHRLLEEYKRLDSINDVSIKFTVARKANRYFYVKTRKGENVGKLYYRNGKDGKEILLFDPHLYEKERGLSGPVTFWFLPSNDGKKIALSLTEKGKGDVRKIIFMSVDTRTFYADSLYPVFAPQIWTPDGKDFIYSELQTTDQLSPAFFLDIPLKIHRVGGTEMEDKVLLSRTTHPELEINPADLLFISYSPDDTYLMLELWGGSQEQFRRFYATAAAVSHRQIARKGEYKNILLSIAMAGINDTRVPVWQPAKLVAALQKANSGKKPIFLMVNYDSGHWSDKKCVTYSNYANMFSLALWQAGHKEFQVPEANSYNR